MFTSPKKKLTYLKYQTQSIVGAGVVYAEALVNKKRLLWNSEFHLIHVQSVDNGARHSMTVVIPAGDRPTRKQVEEQGYFTVSHLWGPEEKCQPWTDHGIVGTDGQPIEVKVRPEKKETLFGLLSANPGFWWIDVFCAQSETPPAIMGDVYRFCNRCYALVDFPSDGFQRIKAISLGLLSLAANDLVEPYMRRINGRMSSENQSWHESLDDLLGGSYNGDQDDIKVLADFFSCQWFTRVWTLQEYLLPGELIFLSEEDPTHRSFDRMRITPITEKLCNTAFKVLKSYVPSVTDQFYQDAYLCLPSHQRKHLTQTPGVSRCYFDLTRFDAFQLYTINVKDELVPGLNWMNLRHVSSKFDELVSVLQILARLPRRCMHKKDYIYGVAGILDLNIPKACSDDEVWASFRELVRKRASHLEIPKTSALSDATDMRDVYKAFIWVDNCASVTALAKYDDIL